ncbi:MAG: hypothetical protein QNJ72_18105 [Pleurocapsa sp. MO_226.B13]|nr:hypothetical protein [Pleurocapsa sp. MO_226.B13]
MSVLTPQFKIVRAVAAAIAVLITLSTVVFLPTFQQNIRNVLVLSLEKQGVLVEPFKGAIA